MSPPTFPLRSDCPAGACICQRQALLASPPEDARILRLTRPEEQRLLQRLAAISSLADLRHMQQRLWDLLGLRLGIELAPTEVRSLRGISIVVPEQPGLCRKTRKAMAQAIKLSLQAHPEITYALLDEDGLFAGLS